MDFYFLNIFFLNNYELQRENMKIPIIPLISLGFLEKF